VSARALLGAALFALLVAIIGMALAWPRSEADADKLTRVVDPSVGFGRGVVTTADKARRIVVPGDAVSITLGPGGLLDTSASAFTRGPTQGSPSNVVPNSRLIGTAQFDVALDSRRWYSVRVGDVLIATTGARFSIRFDLGHPPTTSVAVADGEIAIQRIADASNASEAQHSSGSALVYDLVAGNVGWWSDSLPPHIVTAVEADRYWRGRRPTQSDSALSERRDPQ
jgi:hypothetical protein